MGKRDLTPEGRAAYNEYMRNWRKEHREKVNQYQKDWRHRNKMKSNESQTAYWNRVAAQNEVAEILKGLE